MEGLLSTGPTPSSYLIDTLLPHVKSPSRSSSSRPSKPQRAGAVGARRGGGAGAEPAQAGEAGSPAPLHRYASEAHALPHVRQL